MFPNSVKSGDVLQVICEGNKEKVLNAAMVSSLGKQITTFDVDQGDQSLQLPKCHQEFTWC